jgi:hypothetical protein
MILATLLALAGQADAPPAPLLTVTVQKLPATYQHAPVVHLEFDDKGAVSACTLEQSSGSPGIDKAACQQALSALKVPVEKHKAPAARSATIAFIAGAAAPAK